MNPARWPRVQELFWMLRELPAAECEERLLAIQQTDPSDADVVRRMLAADPTRGILDRTSPAVSPTWHTADFPVPERVGPYLVTEQIGRGGMAVVYRAHDPRLQRDVALKFLPASWNRDRAAKARFIGEARAASALDHPHVCPVYDVGSTDDGRLFIAMAYCHGGSLAARLTSGPLPVDDALRIAAEVATALDRAHDAGIVHRDVKPANIAFSERGDARVLDFGVAVLGAEEWASPAVVAGTPAYMAPEQVRGDAVDRRTDVWALGAVLFEMLAGRRAFPDTPADAYQAILTEALTDVRSLRPEVSPAVAAVVARALEKDPAHRFPTAAAMRDAILAARERSTTPRAARRRRVAVAAVAAAIVTTAGALAWRSRHDGVSTSSGTDRDAVAILPFRVRGDASLEYLREGMVDLLAAKLTGEGGLRAADPRAVHAAWRRAVPTEAADLTREGSIALARRVGSGNVMLGDVVGSPAGLVVTATLFDAGGREVSRGSAQGGHTELSSLVDRVVAQLLAARAGEEPQRLSSLTSTSLPALRAYLVGQAAYRRGRYGDALEAYARAVDLDSTFALAALGLAMADGWVGTGHARDRGRRTAWQWRERLSPRDRALLAAVAGPRYPAQPTVREQLEATEQALRLAPDLVDLWYLLGDHYFHHGRVLGAESWESQAEQALRRAVAGDSGFSAPAHHLIGLYARQRRFEEMRALARSTGGDALDGPTADFIRWRTAIATGDASGGSLVLDSLATETLGWMAMIAQDDGVGIAMGERALRIRAARPSTREERFERELSRHAAALNAGRPDEASALAESLRPIQPDSAFHLRLQVLAALFGDGDRARGATAARALGARRGSRGGSARIDACVRRLWALLAPDPAAAVPAESARPAGATVAERLCDAALVATEARDGDPLARSAATAALDALHRTGPVEFYTGDGHIGYVPILLARLHESSGDTAAALRAIRRRPYFIGWQPFLAAGLRHEGRLAAASGDRAGAVRAYTHYLALRRDPAPVLRPVADSVAAELERLRARPDAGSR